MRSDPLGTVIPNSYFVFNFSAIGLYGCKQWGSSEAFEWSNILPWKIWYCLSEIFICVTFKNIISLNNMSSMKTFTMKRCVLVQWKCLWTYQMNQWFKYWYTTKWMKDLLSIQLFGMNYFIQFYKYIRWYAFTRNDC